jgi:hypothetical protein
MKLLAAAALVGTAAAAPCAPAQQFINYADAPDQMRISWSTACAATAAVSYGTSPTAMQTVTGPAPAQYTAPLYTSPYIYHVTLKGLTPGATYYYQVGDSTSGQSDVLTFTAHPGVGAEIPTTVAVIGDPGQTSNSASTYGHVSVSKVGVRCWGLPPSEDSPLQRALTLCFCAPRRPAAPRCAPLAPPPPAEHLRHDRGRPVLRRL